ncbi:MAG: hypothetical protein K2G90_05250 [Muribaculaceae bacterium]|nr:hypothetical protein [Muribaculaceae bacterium]
MKNLQLLDGDEIQYSEAFHELEKPLIDLVAQTSVWVEPSKVKRDPIYPNVKRGTSKSKGEVINGVRIDDNTYPNRAIKQAISKDISFVNYVTCHIWPGTQYDERYHTQLANLVLVPKVIAALTDFCPKVVDVLKYRAYELYNWFPEEETAPEKPSYYPESWGEFIKEEIVSEKEETTKEEIVDLEDYLEDPDLNEYLTNESELEYYNNNREELEIDKVRRRVPKWIRKPYQINATILNSYMELSQNGALPVTVEELQSMCEGKGVEKFMGHYNQMKNFGLRNHAKVFMQPKYTTLIYLWSPVATYIKGLYKKI